MAEKKHRAGFVNIIGNPNVGKSTLMNALVGEKLSIVTAKAQTTRHRIMGIVNGEDYQIVYSDTPGILKPNYRLQESMMNFVDTAIGDADIILYVTDMTREPGKEEEILAGIVTKTQRPLFVALNKCDTLTEELGEETVDVLYRFTDHFNEYLNQYAYYNLDADTLGYITTLWETLKIG